MEAQKSSGNSKKGAPSTARVTVLQVRSAIGRDRRCRQQLASLGLGRIGSSVELPDSSAVRQALSKVQHLIEVK